MVSGKCPSSAPPPFPGFPRFPGFPGLRHGPIAVVPMCVNGAVVAARIVRVRILGENKEAEDLRNLNQNIPKLAIGHTSYEFLIG